MDTVDDNCLEGSPLQVPRRQKAASSATSRPESTVSSTSRKSVKSTWFTEDGKVDQDQPPLQSPGLSAVPTSFHGVVGTPSSLGEVMHSRVNAEEDASLSASPTFDVEALKRVDVILDDGTRARRTVSLSTLPDLGQEQRNNSRGKMDDTSPLLSDQSTFSAYYGSASRSYTPSLNSADSDSDSDASADSSITVRSTAGRYTRQGLLLEACQEVYKRIKLTEKQSAVLKCSIAYGIASLFTFIPALNDVIGGNRVSSHLVATTTVFFNPAKTLGGMTEAAFIGSGYVTFAILVCLGSMLTTEYLYDHNQAFWAHFTSLVLWLGISTFLISYGKARYSAKPIVATASSLAFIIIFLILVRESSSNFGEFDTNRIEQIGAAVAMGMVITTLANILLWPTSAGEKLKSDISTSLSSFRTLLKLLTKTFLLDTDLPSFTANQNLHTAIESHRASFTAMSKSLSEARWEVMNCHTFTNIDAYEDVMKSLQRLAQHLGGLRSSCGVQFEILKEPAPATAAPTATPPLTKGQTQKRLRKLERAMSTGVTDLKSSQNWGVRAAHQRRLFEDALQTEQSLSSARAHKDFSEPSSVLDGPSNSASRGKGGLVRFIKTVGPSMKSLAYTCKQTLIHLERKTSASKHRTVFDWLLCCFPSQPIRSTGPSFDTLHTNLSSALELFSQSQAKAISNLYRNRKGDPAIAQSAVFPGDAGERVFLVYFFGFCLQEFARELLTLLRCIQCICEDEPTDPSNSKHSRHRSRPSDASADIAQSVETVTSENRRAINTSHLRPTTYDSLHNPAPTSWYRKILVHIWSISLYFKAYTFRYAIKASVTAVLLAIFAFMESTGPTFRKYRMEWSLITLMVVMTPTVGSTNSTAVDRVLATLIGCTVAVIFWSSFPGDPMALALLTFLFSLPNFYFMNYSKRPKMGRFTLLAYNLVILTKFNNKEDADLDVADLAWYRSIAVIIGVIVGVIATNWIWPYEARVELRKGLSELLLGMSWLYQKLVAVHSKPSHHERIPGGVRVPMDDRPIVIKKQQAIQLELKLQSELLRLNGLLKETPNEPRLKGPFPIENYSQLLRSCQNIMDRFVSMRIALFNATPDVTSSGEEIDRIWQDFAGPVNTERKQMVGDILLYFYVLASALRLKTPLPPMLPPARVDWLRLVSRIRELPAVKRRELHGNDATYISWYAFIVMMEDVVRELDKMGDRMSELFGRLVSREEWESIFLL